ncbi:MAG: hypothetical protein P4M10_01290 [Verrucomicrobiae bacterium]|nr:hypothetical protein [Verrucomicrobiae bacterium]
MEHLFLMLVLTAMAAVITGCSSVESENSSQRPWNSPEGWQTGALGNLMDEQHR